MNFRTRLVAAAIVLTPAVALPGAMTGVAQAQSTTIEGARGGADAGGAVGGPLGAAVGGTVGAAVGAAVEIPNAVVQSIAGAHRPSVVYREELVVGRPLPSTIEVYEVPRYAQYRYAVVNNHQVIVDAKTRRILRVVE